MVLIYNAAGTLWKRAGPKPACNPKSSIIQGGEYNRRSDIFSLGQTPIPACCLKVGSHDGR